MKRLLSVLMICLLLIQLSACGLNSEEKDTGILYLKNPIDNSVTEIKVDSEKVYFANGEMLAFESSLDVYEMVETLGKKNPNYLSWSPNGDLIGINCLKCKYFNLVIECHNKLSSCPILRED